MICYIAVSGVCKALTNITFNAQCICVAFVTVTASGLLTTMVSHRIFCKRGKPKQGLNNEKKPPPLGEKGTYMDFLFFRGGGVAPKLARFRAAMHSILSLYGK